MGGGGVGRLARCSWAGPRAAASQRAHSAGRALCVPTTCGREFAPPLLATLMTCGLVSWEPMQHANGSLDLTLCTTYCVPSSWLHHEHKSCCCKNMERGDPSHHVSVGGVLQNCRSGRSATSHTRACAPRLTPRSALAARRARPGRRLFRRSLLPLTLVRSCTRPALTLLHKSPSHLVNVSLL